jgi:hypothetical protein
MDETMLVVKDKKVKSYVPKDMKTAKRKPPAKPPCHITIILCIAADGTSLKPTAILPVVHMPGELDDTVLAMFNWGGSSSGWITELLFLGWVTKVFIPEVVAKRKAHSLPDDHPALLWTDGHGSRCSAEAIKLLQDHHITASTIPSHTSHILQPLDCGVNRAFKAELTRHKREVIADQGVAAHRKSLLTLAHKAVHFATYEATIKAAWAEAGLFPWSPLSIANDEVKVDPSVHSTPSRGSVVSGVVLTSAETIRDLNRISEEKKLAVTKKEEKQRIKLERDTKRQLKSEDILTKKDASLLDDDATPKKRGRPPKPKLEKETSNSAVSSEPQKINSEPAAL